jgi:single-stranded-DNA-specific exonuclease
LRIVRRLPQPDAARALVAAGVAPTLARIYAARGVRSIDEVEYDLARLPSWSAFKGIEEAAKRLADAVTCGERILIIADYDADGATACAVGIRGLKAMGASVDFLVPNRFEFGYGLTPEIVALAAQRQPQLIITVDNGIASVEGVAAAHSAGIDVLVTDHHLPGDALPSPAWIVNPNQPGCAFPSKNLAGVGVIFYVLSALRSELRSRGHFAATTLPNLASLLDLVALGTVADVVKLDHVNRILVEHGLRRIRAGRAHAGIHALLAAAKRDAERASAYDLGFVVGPRLNAAGRMADMSVGIACLIADDPAVAQSHAEVLEELNGERREVEAVMQEQALAAVDSMVAGDAYTLCVYRADWHQGVVGLVASRLKERFHRPVVAFALASGGELRGSGRAIHGFHLRDAFDLVAKRAPGTIERFGGHAFAAGLTLTAAALPRFAAEFETVAKEWLEPAALAQSIETDGELEPDELGFDLAQTLARPVWGQGFPAPVFDGEFVVCDQRIVANKHRRLVLACADKRWEGIVFNDVAPLPERIRAAYRPELNYYGGLAGLQLVIEAWHPAAE